MIPQLPERLAGEIADVLARYPQVESAVLFGSRAKGTATERSDVDIMVRGNMSGIDAERIALDLEDIPTPLRIDLIAESQITHEPLRQHIERVGITIFQGPECTR